MTSSLSEQDELNHALWLVTRVGKVNYLTRSGLRAVSREKIIPGSQIINPVLTKLFRSRFFFLFFGEFMDLDSVRVGP